MKKLLVISGMFIGLIAHADNHDEASKIDFSASYKGDFVANLSGGLKTGATYLGYATMGARFDTSNLGLWNHGEFLVEGATTHGGTPTQDLIGDIQGFDNIEAGTHVYLQQLWFKQTFGPTSISIGLQDLNADYVVCEEASNFLNSSFGIHAVMTTHIEAPIFPITGLGLNFKWNINERWSWQAAIYDGGPLGFEDNPYNVKWKLSSSRGYLTITEATLHTTNGIYKIGGYYHTKDSDQGYYLSAEQKLISKDDKALSTFIQMAFAPKSAHDVYGSISGGVNMSFFDKDCLGIGFSSLWMRDKSNETAIEANYKYDITKNIFIQPDIQYIIRPSGSKEIKNALVSTLRFGIDF